MNNIKHLTLLAALTLAGGTLLAGCDVEQTEEGALPDVTATGEEGQLPRYDVDVTQTQEGNMPSVDMDAEGGKLPRYDVDTADVNVGTREAEVSVPEVDVNTRRTTVDVPTVDVDMPEDEDDGR